VDLIVTVAFRTCRNKQTRSLGLANKSSDTLSLHDTCCGNRPRSIRSQSEMMPSFTGLILDDESSVTSFSKTCYVHSRVDDTTLSTMASLELHSQRVRTCHLPAIALDLIWTS